MTFKRKVKLDNGDIVMDRRLKSIPFSVLKWLIGAIVFAATTYAGYINFAAKVPELELMCRTNDKRITIIETKMDFLVSGMEILTRRRHGERR